MMKPWGGPLRDVSSPGDEARGIAIAKAFEKHMDELFDSLPDDLSDDFYQGFLRACDEIEVNLHYYVDGRLPREVSK